MMRSTAGVFARLAEVPGGSSGNFLTAVCQGCLEVETDFVVYFIIT